MAPLFTQRPKEKENFAASAVAPNTEPNRGSFPTIPSGSKEDNGGGDSSIETTSGDIHFTSVSGVHHPMNHHHLSSGSSGDGGTQANYPHHESSGTIPPPLPPFRQNSQNASSKKPTTTSAATTDPTAIRKYLVLLQDCFAIKFAPLVTGHQSHPYPFAFNCAHNNHNKNCGHCSATEDDDLMTRRQSNLSHHRVVSTSGCNNAGNKCNRNSISEPLTTTGSKAYLQKNNLSCNDHVNNKCSHQHNHFTLGSNHSVGYNNGDPQQGSHHKSAHHHQPTLRQHQFHVLQSASAGGTLGRLSTTYPTNGIGGNALGSNTAEVDHSLHALYLYKGFKEANLQCFWNAALNETFQNIQYKGYIVPSTILVGALPKFLSILRTAWSRQMLRSPAGYRIEFIGEIEEVIADPIQRGQFAPLSDSLCWVILELTSLGQEAFVDSIMSALQMAFPSMSCPSRELVFQTLEKLIKERKVYQTSRGYFVVTPDIFRYMLSANYNEFEGTQSFGCNNPGATLDALLHPNSLEEKMSFMHQSWESSADRNRCSSTSTGEEMIEVAPSPKLKRHNSLKLIRQRDIAVTQMSSSTGQRRHSLRLPKSKSCGRMNDTVEDDEEVKRAKVKSSTIEHISRAMRSLRAGTMTSTTSNNTDAGTAGDSEKSKKNKSLLSKLFPFRRSNSKSRNEKITPASSTTVTAACRALTCSNTSSTTTATSSSADGSVSSPPTKTKHSENVRGSAKFISTQTQTSNSTEQLCVPSITLSSSSSSSATPSSLHPPAPASSTIPPMTENNRERIVAATAAAEAAEERASVDMLLNPDCINGDGSHQTRSSSRRSMSIMDESPLYDVLQDVTCNGMGAPVGTSCMMSQISPNFQVGCPVAPPTFPGYHQRGESSRCSTLSSQAASSLGYGSQGHPSFSSNYSPNNLDSGLASYGFYGDGSIASTHSPCGGPSSSSHYGFCSNGHSNPNSNASTIFPQPAKPSAYSSARYKNSYEWYKKRYPNYISPATGRNSPLYASLTAPRSKSRSRPMYDTLLAPMDEKLGDGLVQVSRHPRRASMYNPQCASLQTNGIGKSTDSHSIAMKGNNEEGGTEFSTTTVTQAVKSTTNMELELLLPLGKIMKAALQAKKDAIKDAWLRDELGPSYAAYANKSKGNGGTASNSNSSNNETEIKGNESSIKVNLHNTGAKLRVGEPSTKTEVTTVVNNNGVIETHFDSSSGNGQPLADLATPNMQSTVAIKTLGGVTDVVLVNGKTGRETKLISSAGQENCNNKRDKNLGRQQQENCNERSSEDEQFRQSTTDKRGSKSSYDKMYKKRSSTTCVKISDIGKDCTSDEEAIKVC